MGKLLGRVPPELYPVNQKEEIDKWLVFDSAAGMAGLEEHLKFRTYLVGHTMTVADLAVYCVVASDVGGRVGRWKALVSADPIVRRVAAEVPKGEAVKGKAQRAGVVTRFAPEPSGYLHIGHARAALATEAMARKHGGKFLLRFDDTNPVNENVDFEATILEDTKLLDLSFDAITHTSDYFGELLAVVERMLVEGLAFVDDSPGDEIKQQRAQRRASARRERPIAESLELWKEMREGTTLGRTCVVRAKIDFQSDNGCLRDPVIARCVEKKHARCPDAPPVFPTYDLACPVVDSLSGVTVAMRSWEYTDRDQQYAWFIEKLGLRKIEIVSFSRMSFAYTILGKRYLRAIVQAGKASGWDDPRFPTVRGLRRRGIDPATLKRFCDEQGQSRNQNLHAWDKLWSLNRDIIAKTCPRVMSVSVEDCVRVKVLGVGEGVIDAPIVPQIREKGTRPLRIGPEVLIEKADVPLLKVGEKVTLMHWGNLLVKALEPEIELEWTDDTNFHGTAKINWLVAAGAVRLVLREWSQLLRIKQFGEDDKILDVLSDVASVDTELWCDESVAGAVKGSIWQLERRAEMIIDDPGIAGGPPVGFLIPSGKQGLTPLALPIKIPLVV